MNSAHFNRRKAIHADFTFTVRSEPIPGELRPEWRITLILLMISKCGWGGSMSLKKSHLVCSAASSAESRELLLRMLNGDRHLDDIPLRIDPSLNRAIDYAIAEKLVAAEVRSNTFVLKLLPKGIEIVSRLQSETECMSKEKEFAELLRGKVPNDKVEEILNWETNL
ncbi:MAG: hypothetical protein K9N23_11235 [Akkermansiaceae bacterium]|nr:hypothetical protein [Akkermansiaceae bacterium]